MAMLGHIHTGQPGRAAALWSRFALQGLSDAPPGLVLELLLAQAFAGASRR